MRGSNQHWAVAAGVSFAFGVTAAAALWHANQTTSARDQECQQACDLLDGDFAAANRYGCFCTDREPGGGVFILSVEVEAD